MYLYNLGVEKLQLAIAMPHVLVGSSFAYQVSQVSKHLSQGPENIGSCLPGP